MPERVFKRGDIYWIAFYSKGKEYHTSAKTDSTREAEKILSHYLGQAARNEFRSFERGDISLSLKFLPTLKTTVRREGHAGLTVCTHISITKKTSEQDKRSPKST